MSGDVKAGDAATRTDEAPLLGDDRRVGGEEGGGAEGGAVRLLTWRSLVVMIFYWTCGGPFGIEYDYVVVFVGGSILPVLKRPSFFFPSDRESVRVAGPLVAVIALVVLYFVWSVPQAIVAAELSCLFPSNGGPILWVDQGKRC